MNNKYLIRSARVADIEAISMLFDQYRQFYEKEPNLSKARKFIEDRLLNKDALIYVAEKQSDRLVGICVMYPSLCSLELKPIFILHDLFVSPDHRNTGVARNLLKHAVKSASEKGAIRLDLTTSKNNFIAQRLYESENWIQDQIFLTYNFSIQ